MSWRGCSRWEDLLWLWNVEGSYKVLYLLCLHLLRVLCFIKSGSRLIAIIDSLMETLTARSQGNFRTSPRMRALRWWSPIGTFSGHTLDVEWFASNCTEVFWDIFVKDCGWDLDAFFTNFFAPLNREILARFIRWNTHMYGSELRRILNDCHPISTCIFRRLPFNLLV